MFVNKPQKYHKHSITEVPRKCTQARPNACTMEIFSMNVSDSLQAIARKVQRMITNIYEHLVYSVLRRLAD